MELSSMSAATIVTVEDYLHRTEKPYCEYLDGVLRPKAMPPSFTHSFNTCYKSCSGGRASKP
jgi:hypothetical protein